MIKMRLPITLKNPFHAPGTKLRFFPDSLRRLRSGNFVSPIALEIQPSERCDHSCPTCQSISVLGATERRRRAFSGTHIDLKLLESLWDIPPQGIVLSGSTGDPLSHPEFNGLIEILDRLKCPLVIITNGHRLNETPIEQLLQLCTGIRISLDASNAVEYAATHGHGADWNRTLRNILALLTVRRRLGISSTACSIGLGFLTGILPTEAMLRATQLAADIGVDYIQFRPLHRVKQNIKDGLKLCCERANGRLHVLASDAKYERNFDESRRYRNCLAGNLYSLIDARGDVYFCCHHVGVADACIGSLLKMSWAQILHGPVRQSALSRFPRPSCVPLCRLHDHNEFLFDYLSSDEPELFEEPFQDELSRHAVFL